jgi:hypothetical protein
MFLEDRASSLKTFACPLLPLRPPVVLNFAPISALDLFNLVLDGHRLRISTLSGTEFIVSAGIHCDTWPLTRWRNVFRLCTSMSCDTGAVVDQHGFVFVCPLSTRLGHTSVSYALHSTLHSTMQRRPPLRPDLRVLAWQPGLLMFV